MIDREHLEQCGLHALNLSEESGQEGYEHELRVNPALREELRAARERAAALALSAPQVAVPGHLLGQIEKRLHAPRTSLLREKVTRFSLRKLPAGWAAAALFAILSGGVGVSHFLTNRKLAALETRMAAEGAQHSLDAPDSSRPEAGLAAANADENVQPVAPGNTRRPKPGGRLLGTVGLPVEVKRELDRLRQMEHNRDVEPVGVADVRIMELRPPGSPLPARSDRSLLSSKVAAAVSAALSGSESPDKKKPALPPEPAKVKGQGSSPTNDIIIESGGTVNIPGLNLHPDARVVHQNFPAPSEYARYGLIPLDNGAVWDGHGGLWYPQGGNTWLGQKAPADFQPPDPDEPGSGTTPALRPGPPETTTPDSAEETDAAPYALPLTSKDGNGMIVTQNLPPLKEGESFALWSVNGDTPPVLLGYLPPGESSTGVFTFQLPEGAAMPAGYRITTELAGATRPGTSVILEGP